ncbi:MAG: hypothetical protein WCO48_00750 [Candidatus Taylorbacteria bacterium]
MGHKTKKPQTFEFNSIRATKGYEKIWNYMERLTDTEKFQKWVRRMRLKYNLPINGIRKTVYGYTHKREKFVSFPERLNKTSFSRDVENYSKKLGLTLEWSLVVENYIVYNNIKMDSTSGSMFYVYDLCHILTNSKPRMFKKELIEFLKDETIIHPIAILLSPYSSERDLIDYIKKIYKSQIKPMLESYNSPWIMLGKIRRQQHKFKAREKFIWKNRHVPIKELIELVGNKFGEVMDYTYIHKIIRDKRRKLGQ